MFELIIDGHKVDEGAFQGRLIEELDRRARDKGFNWASIRRCERPSPAGEERCQHPPCSMAREACVARMSPCCGSCSHAGREQERHSWDDYGYVKDGPQEPRPVPE